MKIYLNYTGVFCYNITMYARLPRFLWSLAMTTLMLVILPFSPIQGQTQESLKKKHNFLTPRVLKKIDKGLAFLAKQQKRDGSITARGTYDSQYPGACTAVAVWAFLINGHTPGRGMYGKVMEKGLKYLINNARDKLTGSLSSPKGAHRSLYEHALILTVLCDVYGEWNNDDLPDAIREGLQFMIKCQNADGSFPYGCGQGGSDMTCHATNMIALRAAQEAFFNVPKKVMKKAARYMKRHCNRDGSFSYSPSIRGGIGGQIAIGRTGMGVITLWASGEWNSKELKKGVKYLSKHRQLDSGSWQLYSAYYAVRAMYQSADNEKWKRWYKKIQKLILRLQRRDGSFNNSVLDTGFGIVALSIEKALLPHFMK